MIRWPRWFFFFVRREHATFVTDTKETESQLLFKTSLISSTSLRKLDPKLLKNYPSTLPDTPAPKLETAQVDNFFSFFSFFTAYLSVCCLEKGFTSKIWAFLYCPIQIAFCCCCWCWCSCCCCCCLYILCVWIVLQNASSELCLRYFVLEYWLWHGYCVKCPFP